MIKDDHFGRMELFMSLLEMNGICKSFNGIQVLKEVSLRVEAGEVHALLGENGAGKSTLMNILTGVHDKDAGTVVFDRKRNEKYIRKIFGKRRDCVCTSS